MKKNYLSSFACLTITLLCLNTALANNSGYTISGKIHDRTFYGEYLLLTIFNNDGSIVTDSTKINNNGIFYFSGKVDNACVAQFAFCNTEQNKQQFHFFIENSDIRVFTKDRKYRNKKYIAFRIKGSQVDKQYRKATRGCFKEHSGYTINLGKTRKYLTKHSDAFYAPYLYYRTLFIGDDADQFSKQMEAFSGKAKETYHYFLLTSKEIETN